MRTLSITLLAIATLGSFGRACAGLNDPISFSQPGAVTLTLNTSTGGLDHILEVANSLGPVGTPLLALTDSGFPSTTVLGHTPANIGDTVAVGTFAAGAEIPFRLTNVESDRLGTPGTIGDQVFSGTASSLNPSPTAYYTYVDFVNPTTIKVYYEDLFPISNTDPDPVNTFLTSGYDASFTLTLANVPEPTTLALATVAMVALLWRRR